MNEPDQSAAASPELLPPPPPISGHQHLRTLGVGGYAVVYLYRDELLNREVAVKVLRLLDDGARRQFANEMRVVSEFDHNPAIVPIFNQGRDSGGRPYFVMPYCSGGSLSARVRANGPLSIAEVVDTGQRIGRALAAVHERQWLHRDVKPSNILIDGNDRPRLSDFGIAAPRNPANRAERGDLALSVPWSPPELLPEGAYGSVASDVYSLGATLWHLLVGRSPYEIPGGDNSARSMERRITAGRLPKLSRAGVPAGLADLLGSMLARDPAARPRTMEAVVAGLEALAPAPERQPGRQTGRQTAKLQSLSSTYNEKYEFGDEDPMAPGPGSEGEPESGRRQAHPARRILVSLGVLVVAAAAVLGIGALAHRPPSAAAQGPSTSPTGLVLATVTQPAGLIGDGGDPGVPAVTATRTSATTLQFSWTYSAAQATDTFEWRATDGPQSGAAAAPTITVTDPTGTQLCVQVRVVREDGSDASIAWSPAGCGK